MKIAEQMTFSLSLLFLCVFFTIWANCEQKVQNFDHIACRKLPDIINTSFVGILKGSNRLLLFTPLDETNLYEIPLDSITEDALYVNRTVKSSLHVFKSNSWHELYSSASTRFATATKQQNPRIPFGMTTFWELSKLNEIREFIVFREADWTQNPYPPRVDAILYDISENFSRNHYPVTNLVFTLEFRDHNSKILRGSEMPRLIASSSYANVFYEIVYFQVDSSTVDNVLIQFQLSSDRTVLSQMRPWIRLCFVPLIDNIFFSASQCKSTWRSTFFQSGFLHQGKFYLFVDTDVIIFPEDAINHLDKNFQLKRVPFKDWIQCGEPNYLSGEIERDPNYYSKLFGILTIITALLLLLFVSLLGVVYQCSKEKSIPYQL